MVLELKNKLFEVFSIIRVKDEGQIDLIVEVFLSLGVKLQDITILTKNNFVRISVYFKNEKKALVFKKKIKDLKLKGVVFRLRYLKIENWKEKWAKSFSAFQLTENIDVVPTWRKRSYKKTKRVPIYLSSINAFGTGLHETTSFMAQLIERYAGKFSNFLDIGTGTGILSLVALHSGAKDVTAIDFDSDCVRSAKENFYVNNKNAYIEKFDIAKFQAKKKFDFVAANLITHDLIRVRKKLVSLVSPGGFLAISGISLENLPQIKSVFKNLPLRCLKIKTGKQWVALIYKKV